MIKFKIEDDPVYAGSKLFTPFADRIGVPIDKLNFLLAQLAALLFAIIYRSYFNYKSPTVKYLAVLIPGFLLGYFEFGYQIWNLWILSMTTYIIILKCNPDIVQHVVLFVSIFYLSYLHLRRQINSYGSYIVDITVPTMIAVQKLTSLAFSIHDGMSSKKLSTQDQKALIDQQRLAVTEVPSLLQFFSYIFQFPTLLSGPNESGFNDFVRFVEGITEKEYLNSNKKLVSYKLVALQRLSISFIFMLLFLFVEPKFSIGKIINDDKFLNENSMIAIMFYLYLSTMCQRFKYYHAWKMGETIAILSGFGLIKNDLNEFEYVLSVDILKFEFANNFRNCLTSWNITTQNWLRRISYERSKSYKITKTYLLSAVWHGFYPGYYMTFFSAAILTSASRVVRKYVRPKFQTNKLMRLAYGLTTFLATKILLTYIAFPFVILEFSASLKIYSRFWFSGHILLLLINLVPILQKSVQSKKIKLN